MNSLIQFWQKDGAWVFVLFLLAFVVTFFPLQTSDVFMYLSLARELLQTGRFFDLDPFLFTSNSFQLPFAHEWLSYFLTYSIYKVGGFHLIIFAQSIGVISILFLIYQGGLKGRTPRVFLFGILILALILGAQRFGWRSSLFSDFFTLVTTLVVLFHPEKPGSWKWRLPALFFLWINLHPGFPVGLLLIACRCGFGRSRSEWLKTLGLCVLATLLNPLGWRGVLFPFHFYMEWAPEFNQYIFEHLPTWSSSFKSLLAPWAFFGLIICTTVLTFRSRNWTHFAITTLLAVLGLTAIRYVPMAGYSLLAVLAIELGQREWSDQWKRVSPMLWAPVLTVGIVFAVQGYEVGGLLRRPLRSGLDQQIFSSNLVTYLAQNQTKGNYFNTIGLGGYLIWELPRGSQVYIHNFVANFDFFKRDYVDLVNSEAELNRVISKYNLKGFIIGQQFGLTPLDTLLLQSGRWKLAFSDSSANVYIAQTVND